MTIKSFVKVLLLILLLSVFGYLITRPINLLTSDLGRHLKNGEIILKTLSIPKTNLYSYTYPNFPFINHHWGSGVIFYLVQHTTGFAGLSIFFLILNLLTFLIFFRIAWKYSGFSLAFLSSVLIIPLLMTRVEIRPEIFSYLFSGIFLWVLFHLNNDHKEGNRHACSLLWILPIIELLWVNLHIYFFFGLILIGVFLLEAKNKKKLFIVFIISCLVTLLNPSGLKGVLYPLTILNDYGLKVLENQSVLTLSQFVSYDAAKYFYIAFFALIISWVIRLIYIAKKQKTFSIIDLILTLIVSYIGWKAIRNLALFGYFSMVLISFNLSIRSKYKTAMVWITSILVIFFITTIDSHYFFKNQVFNFDLTQNNEDVGLFLLKNNIKGPIFNNYDIGNYLIYYLYPKEKVFIDGRPEAYPSVFLKKIYSLSMQGSKWHELETIYHFNAIIYYRREITAWSKHFTVLRSLDPNWATVYLDQNFIILLKRNKINQNFINKFEIK